APGMRRPTSRKSGEWVQHSATSPAFSPIHGSEPDEPAAAPRDVSSRQNGSSAETTPQSPSWCESDLAENPKSPAASDPTAPSIPDRVCPQCRQRFLPRRYSQSFLTRSSIWLQPAPTPLRC